MTAATGPDEMMTFTGASRRKEIPPAWVRAVVCPVCDAPEGRGCIPLNQKRISMRAHTARVDLARAQLAEQERGDRVATIEIIIRGGTPPKIGPAGDVTAQRRWTLAPGQDDLAIFRKVTALLNGIGAPEKP